MRDLMDAPARLFYPPDEMLREAPETRILSQRGGITRKARRCTCCGRTIEAGSFYRRVVLVVDGEFQVSVSHDWGRCP